MNALRRIGLGLLLLLSMGALHAGEARTFCYLAVPSAPAKCLFFSCVRVDAQPVAAKKGPFFTLWRSGYWDEKQPDIVVKDAADWTHALELRARKIVAVRPEMSRLPPQVAEFFTAVETVRAAALDQPLAVEPLFRDQHFAGWKSARHLDALVVPDTLGPKERSRRLLAAMGATEKEQGQDPGEWLKRLLASLGTEVASARYYPESNVFIFEAGEKFPEAMELLFSGLQ